MKSNICHNFPSPDLLEGLKDKHLKENAKLFSFEGLQTRFTTLVHLTTDHEKNKNLCKVKTAGESDHPPFIDMSKYYNLS